MSKINAMMDVGRRSLSNSQTALQTVAHNIANKSTEGYSRQRVDMETNIPIGMGKLRIGMGAKAGAVRRINNPFLDKQLEAETNRNGYANARAEKMGRVEQVFNEQSNKGLNQFMIEFFNSFRELASNPESSATRALVKETAVNMAKDFSRISGQLKGIQAEIDHQLENEVEEINAMTSEIAQLNEKIQIVELGGGIPNDERDRRDLLLQKLSEKVNIRVAESKDGQVAVTAGDSALLVSGYEAGQLKAVASAERGTKREGNFDIMFVQPRADQAEAVTSQIRSGTLGGLIEVRDQVVNGLLENIDTMAHSLAQNVNQAHRLGFNRYDQTEGNFFAEPLGVRDAAERLAIDKEILRDTANIAAAAAPGSAGDNRVAIVISALQSRNILENENSNLLDFYGGVVGQIAVSTRKANSVAEHQKNILDQVKNIRESVSGVSLDEEAIKMIEFQKHYDASARIIKVADEMFDTVLSLKR